MLASASPQRRAILEQIGVSFTVRPADVEEETHGDPLAVAEENARRKALKIAGVAVAGDAPPGAAMPVVLGCDTLVTLDGDILGKPRDAVQARAFLGRLQGRTHQVVSGLAVLRDGDLTTATDVTQVHFRPASERLLDWYVATGEWSGRAGGYAIQGVGAALVAGIEGDYLNVVGLPLARLLDLLPGLVPS